MATTVQIAPSRQRRQTGSGRRARPGRLRTEPELLLALRRQNQELREHLQELAAAVRAAQAADYRQVQLAISSLRQLCRTLREDSQKRYWREQNLLYRAVELKQPHLRARVGELSALLEQSRQVLEEFHRELTIFNASGEIRHLPQLGSNLAMLLQAYLEGQEQGLLRVLLESLRYAEWRDLQALWEIASASGPAGRPGAQFPIRSRERSAL
jgi:hypothetical protein